MQVIRYLNDGKTKVSLVDHSWIPVSYYSTIFLNVVLSDSPANTKEKKAYELRFFLSWLFQKRIDLEKRISSGTFLLSSECYAFNQVAKLKAKNSLSNKVVTFKPTSDKHLSNAIFAASIEGARVKPTVTNGRINTAIEYIKFMSREIHRPGQTPSFIQTNLLNTTNQLSEGKRNTSEASKISTQAKSAQSSISDSIFYKLLEIINPDSPENPFKHSRLRNSLIVKLLILTGNRKGSILKLKISDCDFTGDCNLIRITRTLDEKEDIRKYKPSQKTEQHTSYVYPELMKMIDYYIESKRSRYPKSQSHEFIFVSEMSTKNTAGAPLSISSVDYIFKVLSKSIGFKIHPHLLRYKWNEIFSEDTHGMDSEEVAKLRRYAMGWSRDSRMAELYDRFKIASKVAKIQEKRQIELMGK